MIKSVYLLKYLEAGSTFETKLDWHRVGKNKAGLAESDWC
jgi:hypothetical protein